MRTELEAELAGGVVRGVVSVRALAEISEFRDDFTAVMRRCASGNVGDIEAVLAACLKAAGMKPAEVKPEAGRLIEQAGLGPCGEFCLRLLQDAFDKADAAREGFRAAGAAAEGPSADATSSGSPA